MITLSHHSPRYIALHGAYQHRAAIKALADYPDVMWDKQAGAWLVDNRLWDELAQLLGPWLAPASVEFWCDFQEYEPPARRRTKQQVLRQKRQDATASKRWGEAIVAEMHKEA